MSTDETCTRCTTEGRRGSCARLRCYCGHDTCWAFATWVDLSAPRTITASETPPSSPSRAAAWNDRKDSTWIDQL